MTEILIIFFLILLNGVFAMAEIAMVSSRKSRLEAAARKGDKPAKKALELSRNPSRFLSTVQIGITLIGILTGIYSADKIEDDFNSYLHTFELLKPYSETLAITLIVIILTFFSLVLGELVPKRIGLTMPETITKILSYPMYIISVIAAPFIWLLAFTTDLLLKILNIKKSNESHVTEEEIKSIIQEATETGAVQEIEQDIVENVFYLGDRTINTLMTQRMDIDWLNINDSLEKIKLKITSSTHKSFPVCRENIDNVAGMVYSKDILNALLLNELFELEKLLKPPLFLTKNTAGYKALERFKESKQQIALVVDEFGGVQGILTMNDLVDTLVGDFVKQLHEKKEIIPRDDGSFLVDALVPLPEFARYFEIEIAEDKTLSQVITVGGLVLHFGKKIPHTGDKLKWENLSIEIVDMDGRRIDKILVKKIQ
ncbi:hemolysin family protein [Hydrotalea sp.]|uniref:hemolysin family protein n=1 Tax=Hydrotalea sp. TaxID=2881279 RepID=UPI00262B6BA6|nr:hemolysin family protein [Hydrotalea sp.]